MQHVSLYPDKDEANEHTALPYEALAKRFEAHMLMLYGELPKHYRGEGLDGTPVKLGEQNLADSQALMDGDLVKKICRIAQ